MYPAMISDTAWNRKKYSKLIDYMAKARDYICHSLKLRHILEDNCIDSIASKIQSIPLVPNSFISPLFS